MKLCNKCNQKRGGIRRYAIVEDNVLKMLNMCSGCKHEKINKKEPMIEIAKEGVNIKDVIVQMHVEHEKLQRAAAKDAAFKELIAELQNIKPKP